MQLQLFDRRALTDEITLRLSIMVRFLKLQTARGRNDDAKAAEDVVAQFLNALCGWHLTNLNAVQPNYPAVDLGDFDKGIAIQVTVNGTTPKVRDTHEKAHRHKLSKKFKQIIILFLLDKAPGDPTGKGWNRPNRRVQWSASGEHMTYWRR